MLPTMSKPMVNYKTKNVLFRPNLLFLKLLEFAVQTTCRGFLASIVKDKKLM